MEPQKENKLGVMPIGKLLISVSLPLMISMFVQSMYNIVDGIYVASLSENALTATTLAFPAQLMMVSVAIGTGLGVNSLLSRRLGEKDFAAADACATHGLLLGAASSLIFMLFGALALEPYFRMFTNDPELIKMGTDYLRVCTLLSQGIFMAIIGERLLQSTGKSVLSMIAQLSGAIVNIVFDPILIFGQYGFPEMGMTGAAVATVAGQYVGAILAFIFNSCFNKEIHFVFRGFKLSAQTLKDIYVVGFPAIILNALGSIMNVGINRILIGVSTTAVAVVGAYSKLQSFVFMPVFGLVQGLVPIIGYNYGARKPQRMIKSIKLALLWSAGVMVVGTAVFQLFPEQLLGLFSASGEMLSMGTRALRVISAVFVCAGVSIVLSNVFQGIGIGWISLANSALRQLAILLPAAYFMTKYLGLDAAWYSFWIAEIASLIFTLIMYFKVYNSHIKPLEDEYDERMEQGLVAGDSDDVYEEEQI